MTLEVLKSFSVLLIHSVLAFGARSEFGRVTVLTEVPLIATSATAELDQPWKLLRIWLDYQVRQRPDAFITEEIDNVLLDRDGEMWLHFDAVSNDLFVW